MLSIRRQTIFSFLARVIFFTAVIVGVGAVGVSSVQALTAEDIVFPISELGDCKNESSCRTYCDDLSHADACLTFAEKYNLIPHDELQEAKKFARLGNNVGPGGCSSRDQCESYCENIAHIEECVLFGEKHGLIPPDELKEAKQVAMAVKEGAKFPGDCRGKKECQAYCEDGAHIDECLAFAEKTGLIPPEELAEARRIAPLMKSGQMPGGCKGKKECEAYCNDDGHFEECLAFGEKAGFISAEEALMARKTGGKGPGGCKREECRTYCENPAHQDECFAFAQEHGLIPPEELENINRSVGEFRKMLEDAPVEVARCLKDTLGTEVIEGIRAGTKMPGRNIGDAAHKCFEVFGEMRGPENGEGGGFVRNMPPEVEACIAERIGKEGLQNIGKMSPEKRRKAESEMRACFEAFGGEQSEQRGDFKDERGEQGNMREDFRDDFEPRENEMMRGKDVDGIRTREMKSGFQEHFDINAVPEFARECVKATFDSDGARTDVGVAVERCMRQDRPSFENFKNPDEFAPNIREQGFPGEQKFEDFGDFDDRGSIERMMEDGIMMEREGEKFIPQMMTPPPETEHEDFLAPPPSDNFTEPLPTTLEAPQSNIQNTSLLGNILMVVNQLLAH